MTTITKAKAKDDSNEPETVEVTWAYNPNLKLIGTKTDMDVEHARLLISEGRVRLSGRSEDHKIGQPTAGLATQSLDVAASGNNPPADTSGS